ncbi:MAG: pentapeptide repeat-containing protein [Oscillospiraceae bacterium]|nr:pentapeptide repeat-containing protein [Oscillospiraceae bacterium]
MKTHTDEELKEILRKHELWLKGEAGGERANLSSANLRSADLRFADLSYADLRSADLRSADLSYADLRSANLSSANLRFADLSFADLRSANLRFADLTEVKNIIFPMACPDTGAFIAWKKVRGNLIVKLEIPEDARRSSSTGRKCRCDKAIVLDIQKIDGTSAECSSAYSMHAPDFEYKVGNAVEVSDFCPNRWEECAAGIHFFINRQEAVNYE